ncbi:hypothetical protein KF840_23030 [bacterium]|nr:hypothetical protein [bacterium]
MARRRTPTTAGAAPELPAIPTDTPEGIRIHAIADTIRALDEPLPEYLCNGLELQTEDERELGKRLGVPALFIASILAEGMTRNTREEDIEEYIAWRQRVAGKAGA